MSEDHARRNFSGIVVDEAQKKARDQQPGYMPTWYWANETRAPRWNNEPKPMPLDNNTLGTFLVDDKNSAADAYNDLDAAGFVSSKSASSLLPRWRRLRRKSEFP